MRLETIIKRTDGTRVKIIVEARSNYTNITYVAEVYHSAPRKKLFTKIDVSDNYSYRKLPFGGEERAAFELAEQLKYVSEAEILQAKLNLWESIKPQ